MGAPALGVCSCNSAESICVGREDVKSFVLEQPANIKETERQKIKPIMRNFKAFTLPLLVELETFQSGESNVRTTGKV